MDANILTNVFIFLAAACVAVPLMGKLKLGSVLGYLLAGVLIGPYGLGLIENAKEIMHFAEFGIVMMLFLIGLELDPSALWRLRRSILGLGGLQVLLTSAGFAALGLMWGYGWHTSLAVGMALSLSSTALVLQIMQEKNMLQSRVGQRSFAVLLFQDIAVIPMLVILPLLAAPGSGAVQTAHGSLLSHLPAWISTLLVLGVIAAIVMAGRPLSRLLFDFVARTNLREVFTATSLAVIVGITLVMLLLGVSPALGAFIAGVVLANSEYRHTLMADIEPFKGLLLGLFFISVGMGMNFALIADAPMLLVSVVATLILMKMAILLVLGYRFGLRADSNTWFATGLAQGGEFAFVLLQYTVGLALLGPDEAALLVLAVALSMAATPLLLLLNEKLVAPRFIRVEVEPDYDTMNEHHPVIIAGYGRMGQIVGRFLRAQGVGVTVLEKDIEQITLLRKFGTQGYYGDAARLDHLRAAGAEKAKLLILLVNAEKCLEIVHVAKQHFPKLQILARARNRRHAYELDKAGVDYFHRETFDSSLAIAKEAMVRLGADPELTDRKAERFAKHDEQLLRDSFAFFDREPELVSFTQQASGELARLLKDEQHETRPKRKVTKKPR